MEGTLQEIEGRYVLRFERQLAHSPEKVWRALTEASELAHWFPSGIHGAREKGAALLFVFPGDEGSPLNGEMLVYDPPRTLEYSWGGDILRFELQPREVDTLLVFKHTFTDESKAAREASGWEVCLDALESRLAGAEPEPFTLDRFNVLFDEYAERFGGKASARREPG
jgi:uncharacterized protein YndB with AHSA1/START domain